MISFFSIPKPFVGQFTTIQMNALRSWRALSPDLDILLFGDAQGVETAAGSVGARHFSDVMTNEFKTPLLHDVFATAEDAARYDLLCFLNADIILMSDFLVARDVVSSCLDAYLMVGQRLSMTIDNPLEIDVGRNWEASLRLKSGESGGLDRPSAIDYFVFHKGLFGCLPPFAVGRPPYDHWLVARALEVGVPVVDATDAVMAVHQRHDYSHVEGGQVEAYHGEEARRNQALAGDFSRHRDIGSSTLMFGKGLRIVPARGTKYVAARRRLWRRRLISWSRPIRHFFRTKAVK